jgi:zeaxanthin glucosyltransferase
MARILFAMAQETGHWNATFAVAKVLRTRGHEVKYLAMEDRGESIRKEGFETIPIMSEHFPRGFEKAFEERERHFGRLEGLIEGFRFMARARAAFDELVTRGLDAILARERPELCLVDTVLAQLGVVVHQAGTPMAMVSTTMPLGRMPEVPPLGTDLPPGEDPESRRRIEQAWRRNQRSQASFRLMARLGLGPPDFGGQLFREARRRGFPREWIQPESFFIPSLRLRQIVLCPRAFEFPQAQGAPELHFVGPCVDLNRREPDFPWERLSPDKPLVYCSLGSAPQLRPHLGRFLESVLGGMKARPQWQWVLSTGEGAYADTARQAPAEAVVVPYAPQLALLSRAAVMVTHGGMNSAQEALLHGVPLVVLPCMLDQPGNAARVEYHRVGVKEDISQLTAERLIRAVEQLLGEPSYRQRAQEMSRAFREQGGIERACALIEAFLDTSRAGQGAASAAAR